jgi:hypothetical protein
VFELFPSTQSVTPSSGKITLADADEMLVKLVEDTVESETWKDNGGNIGSIREFGGSLIVTQTAHNQDEVEALLDKLADTEAFKPLSPDTRIPRGGRVPRWPTTR